MLGHELIEDLDHPTGRNAVSCLNGQTLSREVVDDRQQLESSSTVQLIEYKVVAPDMILSLGTQPRAAIRTVTDAAALPGSNGDLEAFFATDPAHALAVDLPRLAPQFLCQPTIAIPRMTPCQSHHSGTQPPLSRSLGPCRIALRRSRLTHKPAGSSLRIRRGLDQMHYCPPPA
ncbi:MAG TPA: hypothetical protein VEL28_09210 [Candidatus Binatia bacterium]|nr:hypothetical protein [Candidatus Binatia bacterium]